MAKKKKDKGSPEFLPFLGKMFEQFSAADEPLPKEYVTRHPCLNLIKPIDEIAQKVVQILHGRDLLFRRVMEIGTVDEAGEWMEMGAERFRTWLPAVAGAIPYQRSIFDEKIGEDRPLKCSIPLEITKAVLASDELRLKLPEIRQINQVRLPIFREDLDERDDEKRAGFRKIDLLPAGYDAASRTFTIAQSKDFDEGLDSHKGFEWLRDLLKYFPFSDPSRLAVQVAAQLTVFGQNLFSGRSPMFLWNSNLAGSGKSRLSQLALEPIYGDPGKSGYSYDSREEVRKELDAAAQMYAPYIWFDDLPKGTIRNTDLNRWLTAKTWRCRILGTKSIFNGPLSASTFMTGAQIELDPMLARRTLVIDLFPHERARNRVLPEDAILINDAFFEDAEKCAMVNAALWSLIRWWDDCGRPGMRECPSLKDEQPLESFEAWSAIIPPVVAAANFGNCLAVFEAPDAGDTETREFEELAKLLIKEHAVGRDVGSVTAEQVIVCARLNGLFIETLGSLEDVIKDLDRLKSWEWEIPSSIVCMADDDPQRARLVKKFKAKKAAGWTDKRIQATWGKKWKKSAVSGQWFMVEGDVWEFGSRATAKKTVFPITKIVKPDNMPARLDTSGPAGKEGQE